MKEPFCILKIYDCQCWMHCITLPTNATKFFQHFNSSISTFFAISPISFITSHSSTELITTRPRTDLEVWRGTFSLAFWYFTVTRLTFPSLPTSVSLVLFRVDVMPLKLRCKSSYLDDSIANPLM